MAIPTPNSVFGTGDNALVSSGGNGGGAGQNVLNNLDLSNGQNYINTLANKYIVKPKNAAGINGFIFDYEGETNVTNTADVPDHYLENNDAVQDHIAIHPVRITLRGFVAEKVQSPAKGVLGALNTIQSKLTAIPAYLGKYTPGGLQKIQSAISTAQNTVNTINQNLSRVQNLVGLLPGAAARKTKQQKAYAQLYALFSTRTIFGLETPYQYFPQMVIESLSFIQPDETKDWSDISVTLKQLRFVQTQTTTVSSNTFASRAAQQRQDTADQGNTKGRRSSLLFSGGASILKALTPAL
jgi:hypothetical protein